MRASVKFQTVRTQLKRSPIIGRIICRSATESIISVVLNVSSHTEYSHGSNEFKELFKITTRQFHEFTRCEGDSGDPNISGLYKCSVMRSTRTKQPQATYISCHIPANMEGICLVWLRYSTSVPKVRKKYIYSTWTCTFLSPGSHSTCQHVPILEINCCAHCILSLSTSGCIPGGYSSSRVQHVSTNRQFTENLTLKDYFTQHEFWGNRIRMSTRIHILPHQWYGSSVFFAYAHYLKICSGQKCRHRHVQQVFCWSWPRNFHHQQSQELRIDIRCQVSDPSLVFTRDAHLIIFAGSLKVSHSELRPSIMWVLLGFLSGQTLSL